MSGPDARGGAARTTGDHAQAVVAFGGGHGLYASLSALRILVDDLTVDELAAVVTVADNGGSSGRLRREFGVLPPGDLRMALAALCGDDRWGEVWAQVMQHRFAGEGEMNGHNLGNMLIVGLWELLGDHVEALDWVGRLLGAKGQVFPMALVPMDISAQVHGLDSRHPERATTVRGQVEVATTEGMIESIELVPDDPPVADSALAAIAEAEWVFIGPGSWFTSVLPHLMVRPLREALMATEAKIVLVMNLAEQAGETGGLSPAEHLAVFLAHAPEIGVHTVLADSSIAGLDTLTEAAASCGSRVYATDVAAADGSPRHDHERLAAAYAAIMAGE